MTQFFVMPLLMDIFRTFVIGLILIFCNMKFGLRTFGLTVLAAVLMLSCSDPAKKVYNQGINIIPAPRSMEVIDGAGFVLSSETALTVNCDDARKVAEFFASRINASTGYDIAVFDDSSASRQIPVSEINIRIDTSLFSGEPHRTEAYRLSVECDGVKIEAAAAVGAFYAMQSFMQLLPAEIESPDKVWNVTWSAPAVRIEDAPRFGYRGIMLDVCRHFRSVDFIKKQLDVMAMFKINRLHWHLTEDQAWRVEIKKYPRLTEIGSRRVEGEGFVHEGFYTQDQIRDVVAYAAERFITVVPELEVPGHELAAIAAYPELSCANVSDELKMPGNEKSGQDRTEHLPFRGSSVKQPWIIWGVNETVMCPGKELMFEFLEDVIDEMAPLFPGEYFHIGGDECPKASWKVCPDCQRRIKELGLVADDKHSAEDRLQSYVISRVSDMLARHGKKIIGWDEILEGGLAEGATVMSWRGEFGGIAAATMGHSAIMTPSSAGLYFDHYQGDPKVEPVGIGGYSTLERVYAYDAIPSRLVEEGKSEYIMGVQANLWSEYLYEDETAEYRLYPRALALAEIAWTMPERKDFNDFCRRVDNACVRLDGHGINYHIPQPEQPYGSCDFVAFTDTARIEFKTTRPVKILYTLNGMDPRRGICYTVEYKEPIILTRSEDLRVASVLPSGKMSPVRHIKVRKQKLLPAVKPDADTALSSAGYDVSMTEGLFFDTKQLFEHDRQWRKFHADRLLEIRGQRPTDEAVNQNRHYATIAEGSFQVPEDGVYFFSSNNTEVWVDGHLVVDNNNEVKRFSRHDSSLALQAGVHRIRIIFLGHVRGGVPSYWDDASVRYRLAEDSQWKTIL